VEIPHFRPGSDDDRFVIPELIHQDMYRATALAAALEGVEGTILDCGAHIGVFSALLAARGVCQSIEAFEPEPSNYALLVKNVTPYPTITPLQLAVGRANGEQQLFDGGETGRWSFVPPGSVGGRKGVSVRVIDLYEHIRQLDRVALLKLDLEGFEAELLNSMPADVLDRVQLLLTEEHHLPIDHTRLLNAGFTLWFHPRQDPRQRVYRANRQGSRSGTALQATRVEAPSAEVVVWRRPSMATIGVVGQLWGTTCPAVAELLPPTSVRLLDLTGEAAPSRGEVRVSNVVTGDAENDDWNPGPDRFDAILCGRLLEQVRDPGLLLHRAQGWLRPGGSLLARVANVRHHLVLRGLIEGAWGADPSAEGSSGRIRFFTRREIEKLFYRAGYVLDSLRGVRRPEDRDGAGRNGLNLGDLQIVDLPLATEDEFFSAEYLIRATPAPVPDRGVTSIVILTHNQLAYTRLCLDSIRLCTDEPYEVIVVDNASTDGTPDYLGSLSGITLIRNQTNRGFPAAANQGMQAARGRQVLLLNNDTVVTTGWLRRMLDALHSDPAVGLVGPCSNRVSGEQQVRSDYDEDLVGLDGFAWEWGKTHNRCRAETDRLVGFCLLVRREVIDRIGFLDERFGVGCFEDDDYCRRTLAAGFRAVIAQDAFVHHFAGRTFIGSGVDFAELMHRNQTLYEKKWQSNGHAVAPTSVSVPSSALAAEQRAFGLRKSPGGGLLLERRSILVSLCMIVRNNAGTLEPCLTSIRPWVDEMIVVDTGSTDETPRIAARLGARVYHFPWCDSFSAARNESLRHARGNWVFWMDSDDTISEENGRKLRALAEREPDPGVLGYVMQVHCPGAGEEGDLDITVVDHVKLFRNLSHLRFEGRIHEQILGAIRRSGGEVAWSDVFVVHSGYDHTPEGQEHKKQRDLKLLGLELQDQPEHPFTLFNLGMTYADIGEFAQAVDFLARSIRRSTEGESHLRKAYALLVYCLSQLHRPEEARACCARGLSLFPEDVELRFRQAILLHEDRRFDEAAAGYLSILEGTNPRYFSSVDRGILGFKARQNLALVYADQGDLARCEEQWRLVVREAPRHRPGWHGLAEVLLRRGKSAEVAVLAERLMNDRTLRIDGLLLRGRVAAANGSAGEAEHNYRAAVAAAPDNPEPLEALSRMLFDAGRPGEAIASLEALVRLRPRDAAALHNLGSAHVSQGQSALAVKAYSRSVEMRPDSVATWLSLGDALRDAGRPREAERAWDEAARLDPSGTAAREARRRRTVPTH
jgi:FkbM family methyltransferase